MPIMTDSNWEFFSRSSEQTRRLGTRLGAMLKPGDLICLSGDLGAGKTTLVQGIAQGFGSLDPVSSPTFVLVNVYRREDGNELHHLDVYRLGGVDEAVDLDLDTLIETGTLVIEWAERIKPVLPREALWVHMRYISDEQRNLLFEAAGERYQQIMGEFRRQVLGG
jgi:tRNA threonylcarbamoyladenosine biosynthesis protein TsaE